MAEESVIIDVKVDVAQVQRDLATAIESLSGLKKEQRELRKEIEAGNDANGTQATRLAEVNKQIDKNNRVVRSHTALLQSQGETILDTNASLDDQRQQLKQLQALYGTLSGEAKRMADQEGGLAEQIKSLTDQVREQEHAIGDDRRNVGNYTESLGKLSEAASIAKTGLEGMAGGSTAASKAMDGLDKISKAFSKNPYVGILAVIVTTLTALASKIKENEKQMKELQVATATVSSVFEIFVPIVTKLADVLARVLVTAIGWVTSGIERMLQGLDRIGRWLGKEWNLAESFQLSAAAASDAASNTETLADKAEAAAAAVRKLREERIKLWAEQEERERIEREVLERMNDAQYSALETTRRLEEEQAKAAAQLQALMVMVAEDDEEGEDIPSVEDMVRQRFGLDEEGVAYFKSLIAEGVSAQEAGTRAMAKQTAKTMQDYAKLATSLSGSLETIGASIMELVGESQKSVKAQKVFGLASIIIKEAVSAANTAAAITEAVEAATRAAAATGVAAPFTQPVFVATMVATIAGAVAGTISNIVAAKNLLQSAPTDAGRFATGGIVGGSSFTGDNVVAHVNSGEAILTQKQQAQLLEIANGRVPSVDYEAITDMLVTALAAQPAPVMDYSEFTGFRNKVLQYNEMARI